MFAYLSKKIAIPNNFRLNCIAWNEREGYIAVGGEDGLLKVLRVDSSGAGGWCGSSGGKSRSTTGGSNLSMNQTLEGHEGHVQAVAWNEQHRKLTSSDRNGVIIVWMLYKGSWYDEMINNCNKSVVRGMAWSVDGLRICIAYEDGTVILGSVDGNRIWGKELKRSASLVAVQWSPDGKSLLFGAKNGEEVHLYDDQGVFLTKMNARSSNGGQCPPIVCMQWYDGRNGYVGGADCPTLAVCYRDGHVLLTRDTNNGEPTQLETGITSATWACWNSRGSVLAVVGMRNSEGNAVQFYTPFGKHLRTLRVPGREVTCCAWEAGSLRLALAVDSHIYFANLRPDYKWTYFATTLVYTDDRVGKEGVCVTFWNTSSHTCCTRHVSRLLSLASYGDHCVLAVGNDGSSRAGESEEFCLLVCNSIATPIDRKSIDFEPTCVRMTGSVIVAACTSKFLVWRYHNPRAERDAVSAVRVRGHKVYHVDETPTGVAEVIQDLDRDGSFRTATRNEGRATADPIRCAAVSDAVLLVARESGMTQRYSLPQVTLTRRYNATCKPREIAINCDSSRASLLDANGVLTMLDLEQQRDEEGNGEVTVSRFQRRDVWAMRWADDNPGLLAVMEKSRMYVLRDLDPEEPISCSGYICSFNDLVIRCALLDELMRQPDEPKREWMVDLEVKSLRDTRELLTKVGVREAGSFVQDNPHPRLWRLLAESALQALDLETAESAMVRCADYLGIRFIKRLRNVYNDQLRRAEVAAYLGNYDQAEELYLDMDRRDLAVSLRQKLADHARAIQLMKTGIGGWSDRQMEHACDKIAEQYAEQQHWDRAREYFERSGNVERLIECYYKLEDYVQLANTVHQLPDNSPPLKRVARMLAAIGMCSQAVAAYLKYGDVKLAVDTCVRLNRWDRAVELAKTYKMARIDELLNKYADHLLSNGKRLEAIQLYRKANCNLAAARLLLQLADEQAKKNRGGDDGDGGDCAVDRVSDPSRLKKIHVLAGLLIEEHRDVTGTPATTKVGRSDLAMGLTVESSEHVRLLDDAWRGAEAYHFLLLANRQIYAGEFHAATRTALRLREYEDLLPVEQIYCLLALASAIDRAFAVCSKAFARLESLDNEAVAVSSVDSGVYESLAVEIFGCHAPENARNPKAECTNCESLVPDWCVACPNCATRFPACVASGKSLMDLNNAWTCTVCKHHADIAELDAVAAIACPLCHSAAANTAHM